MTNTAPLFPTKSVFKVTFSDYNPPYSYSSQRWVSWYSINFWWIHVSQVSCEGQAEEVRPVCHKQKAVRFHRSDSNSPISCSESPWRGLSYETGTTAGLWVFTRDSSTQITKTHSTRLIKHTHTHTVRMLIMCVTY